MYQFFHLAEGSFFHTNHSLRRADVVTFISSRWCLNIISWLIFKMVMLEFLTGWIMLCVQKVTPSILLVFHLWISLWWFSLVTPYLIMLLSCLPSFKIIIPIEILLHAFILMFPFSNVIPWDPISIIFGISFLDLLGFQVEFNGGITPSLGSLLLFVPLLLR